MSFFFILWLIITQNLGSLLHIYIQSPISTEKENNYSCQSVFNRESIIYLNSWSRVIDRAGCGSTASRPQMSSESLTSRHPEEKCNDTPAPKSVHLIILILSTRFGSRTSERQGAPPARGTANKGTAGEPFREWSDQHVRSCQSVEESCPGIFWEGQQIRLTTYSAWNYQL